jgi:hypothetical protein
MSVAQIVVTALGVGAIVWVWWFFGPAGRAPAAGRSPRGGQAIAGTGQTADCSERLVLEHFGIDTRLPAFETTPVEFTPHEAGEFPFRCGRSILQGLLVVEPANHDRRPAASPHRDHA